MVALLAASLSCGRSRERAAPIVDPERLPRYAACSADCDQVLLEELRAAVRARPKLPMLEHQLAANPAKAIEEIRSSGWKVRDHVFRVELPIDWNADPFGERHWRFRLSSMQFVTPFLQQYEKAEDAAALSFAKAVLLDWIDFNLVRDRPNDYRWYDHATGLRAVLLGYVLDRSLRRDDLTAGELRLLLLAARQHVVHLSEPSELATNNHALFQLTGLAGLCAAFPELIGCDAGPAYASQQFARIVDSQFTADGIQTENSPTYHGYALQAIEGALASGWLALPPEARVRLDRAWANLPWLVRPDGVYAPIGDSSGRPTRGQIARSRAAQDSGAAGDDVPTHRSFRIGGYAVVRSPAAQGSGFAGYLFLTAAYHSQAHKHRDSLSFEWFDAGMPILVDSGVYSTNMDARRDYVLSSRAHNTIEVDGRDIDRGPPRPPALLATATEGQMYVIAAEVAHPEHAARHRRILVYAPGQWLHVHDEISAKASHAFTAWFHLTPAATLRPAAGEVGRAALTGLPEPLRITDLTHGAKVTAVRGQTEPRLQGWVTSEYGKLVPNDAVGLAKSGRTATFDTLFLIGASAGTPTLVRESSASTGNETDLCWRDDGGIHGVRVTVRGDALEVTACRTDR